MSQWWFGVVATLASTVFTPAAAQAASALPVYDVQQWCDTVARSVGPRSELLYSGCFSQEQSAYDVLKKEFDSVPDATAAWCNQVAKATGPGSYQILAGCIQNENAAREENATRKFQR